MDNIKRVAKMPKEGTFVGVWISCGEGITADIFRWVGDQLYTYNEAADDFLPQGVNWGYYTKDVYDKMTFFVEKQR